MLVTLDEMLSWLDIESEEITITANNNTLYFKYDSGSSTAVTLTSDTYTGDSMATHLQTQINSALSCSSVVAYSSNKFTITVTGHTIQYIHNGSTAGYDLGFIADSSDAEAITSDIETGDPTDLVSSILNHVDEFVKGYCRRDFESATYTEIHDGSNPIFLNEFPITALSRVAVGRDKAFSVNNTNSTSYATVSCNGTNFTCNLNGSTNDLALSTYTTLTTLVAAINALGNGWTATLSSSSYGDILSSEIIDFYGKSCLDTDVAYIEIPDSSLDDVILDTDTGRLIGNFPSGYHNVFVYYTAGYSTIPEDLQMAVKILVQFIYNKIKDDNLGIKYYNLGDVRISLTDELPMEAEKILLSYKRFIT